MYKIENSVVPHLLKGWMEWFYAQGLGTTHIYAVTEMVQAPELTKDWSGGEMIVLNIGMQACRDLLIDQTGVSFSATKNDVPVKAFVPRDALIALRVPLNGVDNIMVQFDGMRQIDMAVMDGMYREHMALGQATHTHTHQDSAAVPTPKGRPSLTVVK